MSLIWTHRAHTPAYSLWSAVDARGEVVAQVVREGREWKINLLDGRKGLRPCGTLAKGRAMAQAAAEARP